jgi:ribosomal protein S6--L-glutamate ligase
VNSSPGLQGIEEATRLDVAGAVIDYIAAQVDFPELDVRQRLTVSRGFGVAELTIPEGSDLVGKSIQESLLSARELNVLTLHRGTTVIPNPKSQRLLEGGDRLLCFGPLNAMRDLVPARTQRRRRPKVEQLTTSPVVNQFRLDRGLKDNNIPGGPMAPAFKHQAGTGPAESPMGSRPVDPTSEPLLGAR